MLTYNFLLLQDLFPFVFLFATLDSVSFLSIILYDTAAQPTKVTTHVSYYRIIINWCYTSACGGFDIHQIRLPRGAKQFYSTLICKSINVEMLHKMKTKSVCLWEEEPQARSACLTINVLEQF